MVLAQAPCAGARGRGWAWTCTQLTALNDLAIAAQQAGKAIQHYEGHQPVLWRVSVIRWTVYLSLPLFLLGLLCLAAGLTKTVFPIVILAWSAIAYWNVLTIPTELDAGSRVKIELEKMRVFKNLDERVGVERVIGAASTAYMDGLSVLGSWAARTFLSAEMKDVPRGDLQ